MMNEQQLDDLCIGWFQEAGWQFVHGPDIAPMVRTQNESITDR